MLTGERSNVANEKVLLIASVSECSQKVRGLILQKGCNFARWKSGISEEKIIASHWVSNGFENDERSKCH